MKVLGIVIGLVFGALQYWLLRMGVRSVASNHLRILPLIAQFFCPFAGLLLCAFTARAQLLTCALIIIAILILGAVIELLLFIKSSRKE